MATGEVRINNGVLWVDSEAYPLRNISRVGSRWIDPRPLKRAAIQKFILRMLLCVFVSIVVMSGSTAGGVLILLAGAALLIWRLLQVMKLPQVFGLVLNTSGVQQDAVWSLSENEIDQLVVVITDAIGHPDTAQTIFNLNHVVSGDIIQQYGDDSVGKQIGAKAGSY